MAKDQPGPPGSSNHDDRPGQRPTEPLGGPAQPPEPPPAYGQPGSDLRSPAPTAPLPGDQVAAPAFAEPGPPREALAGFWRRLVAAFLDWLLVGIVAAAIGDLFGVEGPSPPSAAGDGVNVQFQPAPGPFILVELAYFTYFHLPRHQRRPVDRQQDPRDPRLGRQHRPVPAWHDIVADSLVVRTTFYPPGEFGRPAHSLRPLEGVERPPGRGPGGPPVRAACGGHLNLGGWPLTVVPGGQPVLGYGSRLSAGSTHPGMPGLWPSYSSGTTVAARRKRRTS
jgi:hypothetical protein